MEGKRRVLDATIDSITTILSENPELTPVKEAAPLNPVKKVSVSSGVATGLLMKEVRPIYPEDAKESRIQGTVVLQAVIGTDGRVHDLKVIDGPSPSSCSRFGNVGGITHWGYKPYLLNGEQVEVNTTVNVVFNLGG